MIIRKCTTCQISFDKLNGRPMTEDRSMRIIGFNRNFKLSKIF
jgi:hypothetical protein